MVWLILQTALGAPGGVTSDLQVWYRADSVTTVGGEVTVWQDQSGNGRDATNATAADLPELISSNAEISNQPSLRFDTDYLGFDGSWVAGQNYTLFVVSGRLSSPNDNYYLGGTSGVDNNNLIVGYRTNTLVTLAHWGNDLDASIAGKVAGREWNLDVGALDQGAGRSIWRNGPLKVSDGNTTPLNGWAGASVGRFAPASAWFDGDIAEVVMYDRALSCTERITVEEALATRYGLTWSTDDDADDDGVCNDADACPGFDDDMDADGDFVPDGCDACIGNDASGDSDSDGYCDDTDICPGFDDNIDTDGDSVPDGCDPCPMLANETDTDVDGFYSCVDCDDVDPAVFPSAIEQIADGVDQDCDGLEFCYADIDQDGYGTPTATQIVGLDCTLEPFASDNDLDCDDTNPAVNPGVIEVVGNGVDDNCDGFDGAPDTGDTGDTGVTTTTNTVPTDTGSDPTPTPTATGSDRTWSGPVEENPGGQGAGCSCDTGSGGVWFAWLLAVLVIRRR